MLQLVQVRRIEEALGAEEGACGRQELPVSALSNVAYERLPA